MESKANKESKPNKAGVELINRFLEHLRIGINDSLDEKTIKQYKDVVWEYWEHIIEFKNLKTTFNAEFAKKYKEYIIEKDSISTVAQKCYQLTRFYQYLYSNPEKYENICKGLKALKLSKKEKTLRNSQKKSSESEKFAMSDFEKLIDFPENNVIDRRDKALLCFLLLSAGRIDAIRTAPIGSFNTKNYDFIQDPQLGMNTKFSKYIDSTLFRFKQEYIDIIVNWVNLLVKDYKFDKSAPLFPIISVDYKDTSKYIVTKEFYKTQGSISSILRKRFKNIGQEGYSAHKFRHLALNTVWGLIRNGTQFKAVSQNIGHESMTTALKHYANMPPHEYKEIIRELVPNDCEERLIKDVSTQELLEIVRKRLANERSF